MSGKTIKIVGGALKVELEEAWSTETSVVVPLSGWPCPINGPMTMVLQDVDFCRCLDRHALLGHRNGPRGSLSLVDFCSFHTNVAEPDHAAES